MATTPLFTPALASLGDVVPHDGLLSPAELEQIARDMAEQPELWEPLVRVDPGRRRYELVYLMVYGGEDVSLHLRAGDTRQGGPGYIHRVRHEDGQPAVTIHVYSPRLDWVGQYRLGDDGVVRREIRPGRNELTEQLVAQGALDRVLERF
jgi:hypothetical protein